MPVSLPTAADVRRAREQAAQAAAERAGVARTPLLAVLGAGDYAYATVTKAVVGARTRATAQAEDVQHRVAELPQRLSPEALLSLVAELRRDAEERYGYFARRGESTWGWLRKQPPLERTIATIETYTEKLDARVDGLVDGAHDVAEATLTTVTRQTRSTGEKAARTTQRVAAGTAEVVAEVAHEASETVAEAGDDAAAAIADAGADAAATARSTSRRAAHRTEPTTTEATQAEAEAAEAKAAPKAEAKSAAAKSGAPKAAGRKPAGRSATNGTKSGS